MVGNAHGHNKALYLLCPPQACAEGALFFAFYVLTYGKNYAIITVLEHLVQLLRGDFFDKA